MWNKIKSSGLGLAGIVVLLLVFYLAIPTTKSKSAQPNGTKTVEEIIAGSYTKNYIQDNTEWDTTFNSAITPIKDKHGN